MPYDAQLYKKNSSRTRKTKQWRDKAEAKICLKCGQSFRPEDFVTQMTEKRWATQPNCSYCAYRPPSITHRTKKR